MRDNHIPMLPVAATVITFVWIIGLLFAGGGA